MLTADELRDRIQTTAFAFRGYNVTNLGRSGELLAHPRYGSLVEATLREASEVCSSQMGQRVDLVARVSEGQETSVDSYQEAISLILAMEAVQIRLMREFFDIPYAQAQIAFGYSLGEIGALVAGGMFELRDALQIPLAMAADCVELAKDVTLGIVFSRGPILDVRAVQRLCLELNAEGQGVIGISTYLSPNSILVMGQGDTVRKFGQRMHEKLPSGVHLRQNEHRWPPLHTPLVWERNIPNRAAKLMHTLPGGLVEPKPPILSLVTGKTSYNDHNSRELLARWVDQPQRLWDAVYEVLALGVTTIVHVGPEPNLVPATFSRLSDNVAAQLADRSLGGFGLRAVSRAVRRPWLARLLPSRSALLRAPFIEQINLEDWLLEQGKEPNGKR